MFNLQYVKRDNYYRSEGMSFYPKADRFRLMWGPASYFDNRWFITTSVTFLAFLLATPFLIIGGLWWVPLILLILQPFILQWGTLYFYLPIRSKYDECEPPQYGIYAYGHESPVPFIVMDSIWLWNGKEKAAFVWYLPWSLDWYRTSYLLPNNTWLHEIKKKSRVDKWRMPLTDFWHEIHDYTYILKNGDVQRRKATITVEEREWRRRWLMRFRVFNLVRRTINIEFDGEVGERTGSWKGGTIGCSYTLLKNETPLECLRRMEKERKFN